MPIELFRAVRLNTFRNGEVVVYRHTRRAPSNVPYLVEMDVPLTCPNGEVFFEAFDGYRLTQEA